MVDLSPTATWQCDAPGTDSWHFNCYNGQHGGPQDAGEAEVGTLNITPASPGPARLRRQTYARDWGYLDDVAAWGGRFGWVAKELRKRRAGVMAVVGNVLYAHATVTQEYMFDVMFHTAKELVAEAVPGGNPDREARLVPWRGAQLPTDEHMKGAPFGLFGVSKTDFTVYLDAPTKPDGLLDYEAAISIDAETARSAYHRTGPTTAFLGEGIRGLTKDQVASLIDEINEKTWEALLGIISREDQRRFLGYDSSLWSRDYGDNCRSSTRLFSWLQVAMQIGGHTPSHSPHQAVHGKVHQMCAGRSVRPVFGNASC